MVGCGTTNPGYQTAQKVGGAAVGGVVGYNAAKSAGANQSWAVAGGVLGAGTGVAVVEGTQCDARGDCEDTYSQRGGRSAYRHDGYGNILPPGQCPDPNGTGGTMSCEYIARHSTGGRQLGLYDQLNMPNATDRRIYMEERRARGQKASAPLPEGNFLGLTVGNYQESPNVIPVCKTGNFGYDANCLRVEAEKLEQKQKACVSGTGPCRNNYGAIAGAYRNLATKLSQKQASLESKGY